MALIHAAARRLIIPKSTLLSRSSFSSVSLHPQHRIHLLFGANTDVGKSIISTGLVRAAAASLQQQHEPKAATVNYIKPLQCGGSDESFVIRNNNNTSSNTNSSKINSQTLFRWETPASPHLASRWENLPVSDEQVISSLQSSLRDIDDSESTSSSSTTVTTIIETAGGVLSPSSSSPLNNNSPSSTDGPSSWGWSTQADLYAPLNLPVIFVGDGKLGGISVTLASLEALWSRGYQVDAIVFIEGGATGDDDNDDMIQFGKGNTEALREYMNMRCNKEAKNRMIEDESIICLPSLPPMPIPLDDWYDNNQDEFLKLHQLLCRQWKDIVAS